MKTPYIVLLAILGAPAALAAGQTAPATPGHASPSKSLAEYRKLASTGDAAAQARLGIMYRTGKGAPQDLSKALRWLKQAAAGGNAEAQRTLGEMYLNGEGLKKDEAWGVTWLRRAAAQGDTQAKARLDKLYKAAGLNPAQIPSPAPPPAQPAANAKVSGAEKGLSEDQKNALELARLHGINVQMGPAEKIAPGDKGSKGHAQKGSGGLSGFFSRLFGGGDKHKEKAAPADNGTTGPASGAPQQKQRALPEVVDKSLPAPPKSAKPTESGALKAAEAQLKAGNYLIAAKQLEALADKGDPAAQERLAELYQVGHGVPKDLPRAAALYLKAAKQGNAEAQFNLGNMYLMGEGVKQDDAWAATWFRKAAAQGNEEAKHNLEQLKSTSIVAADGLAPKAPPPDLSTTQESTPTGAGEQWQPLGVDSAASQAASQPPKAQQSASPASTATGRSIH